MAATKWKSIKGLKKVYIAELASDTDSATTYGAPEWLQGAIDVQASPNNADPDIQYADDAEHDRLYPDPEIALAIEMAALPLAVQRRILGHTLDANGVTIKNASDVKPYFAVGIRATRADGTTYRNKWYYKCAAKPITETYHTTEGGTVTRQTGKVEFTAIKRISDGAYEAVADDNEDGFTGGATFFASVYETTPATVAEIHALTWALTEPVKEATPEATMNDTGYTSAVTWSPTATAFAGSTVYTATVVITAAAGYVFCPSFSAASIASLPEGATVNRDGDTSIVVTVTYEATVA